MFKSFINESKMVKSKDFKVGYIYQVKRKEENTVNYFLVKKMSKKDFTADGVKNNQIDINSLDWWYDFDVFDKNWTAEEIGKVTKPKLKLTDIITIN